VHYKHPLFRSFKHSEALASKSGRAMLSFYEKWIDKNVDYELSFLGGPGFIAQFDKHAIDSSDWSLI